jgi:chromosome segregation ATPase
MVLFIVLGVIVLITFVVLGVLFYMLGKEGQKEEKAVPLKDVNQIKKEFSSALLEPQKPKYAADSSETKLPFEPKASVGPVSPESQSILQAESPAVISPLQDDNYKIRAKELEDELRSISQKAETQSQEAKLLIDTLTKENQFLKEQKADLLEAQQKLDEVNQESSGLKVENAGLQAQLESANGKLKLLEEEFAVVKLQMGEEISKANAAVEGLTREKEQFQSVPLPVPDDNMRQELDSLKSEHAQLRQQSEDLKKSNQELSEANSRLTEKIGQMQYEMVKARAQSSGLERVSFNYKNQVEDFLKKVNSAQAANDQLSQVKNRLEGMVEQIKLQNEELVKKDQLSQFELEKNRSRLLNLEREYENLKAHLDQHKEPQA